MMTTITTATTIKNTISISTSVLVDGHCPCAAGLPKVKITLITNIQIQFNDKRFQSSCSIFFSLFQQVRMMPLRSWQPHDHDKEYKERGNCDVSHSMVLFEPSIWFPWIRWRKGNRAEFHRWLIHKSLF